MKDSFFLRAVDFWTYWPSKKKNVAIGLLSIGLLGAIFLFKFGTSSSASSDKGLAALVDWVSNSSSDIDTKTVIKTMKQNPSVHERMGGIVAQKLLIVGEKEYPRQYLKQSSRLLSTHCPLYQQFSEISFLIVSKAFQQALDKSLLLKADLEKDMRALQSANNHQSTEYLYVLNLFRIGVLQKQLEDLSGEKATWDELENLLVGKATFSGMRQAGYALMQNIKDEDLTLHDFIQDRKKQIAKKS
jgi:hypothetical protein